jgi:sodium transport system permease protein
MYAVPLMGQQVTITRLLRGDAVSASDLLLCFASSTVAALIAYAATVQIYRNERLAISA